VAVDLNIKFINIDLIKEAIDKVEKEDIYKGKGDKITT
jgi:hypothetical protein